MQLVVVQHFFYNTMPQQEVLLRKDHQADEELLVHLWLEQAMIDMMMVIDSMIVIDRRVTNP